MTGEQIRAEIRIVTSAKSIASVELSGTNILYHLKTGADYLQELPSTGVIVTKVETNIDKHMIVTLSTGVTFDAGRIGVDNRILPAGQDGATYIPHIVDGWLSWTNNADMPNPAPIKIVGEDGVSIVNVEQTETSTADNGINIVTVTLSDESQYTFEIRNGSKGNKGETGNSAGFGNVTASVTNDAGTPTVTVTTSGTNEAKNFSFEFSGIKGEQGIQGVQGVQGEPFRIVKIYTSVAEMEADYNSTDVQVGQFVLINTGNVEDADNAKLFIKGINNFEFITDLSGAQGIQGIQGIQGVQGIQGEPGTSVDIKSVKTEYLLSEKGTIPPSGDWQAEIPHVPQGQYLWTKVTIEFSGVEKNNDILYQRIPRKRRKI